MIFVPFEYQYDVILADPPWSFKCWSEKGTGRSASQHYEILSLDDIKSMNVGAFTKKDCCLFLWATNPLLPEAFEVIDAWGFTYKTVVFTWVKMCKDGVTPCFGNGYWTRAGSELCFLATKGHPKPVDHSIRQVLMSQRREHSRKPDEQYGLIEKLLGNPECKIELFARQTWPGWDSWGNEKTKFGGDS